MQNFTQPAYIDFEAGKTVRVELDTDYFNFETMLRAVGQLTLNGAAPTGPKTGAFLNVIREIKITTLQGGREKDEWQLTGRELLAIYAADNGRISKGLTDLPLDTSEYKAIHSMQHWTKNSSNVHLTGLDLRRKDKAYLSISFGNVTEMYADSGGMQLTNLRIHVDQVAEHSYRRVLTQRVNPKTNKVVAINPAMRNFRRQYEEFNGAAVNKKLGFIGADEAMSVLGFIIYTENDDDFSDAITGNITLSQNKKTLGTVSLDVIKEMHRDMQGGETVDNIYYVPFGSLYQDSEIENTRRWGDKDFEIHGSVSEACKVTVLAVGYAQE